MQGLSELNRELLDASALCRQLVPQGSVEAFLADHRHELFPDEMFEDLFLFDPFHVGASVQTYPGLAISNLRPKLALFNKLLVLLHPAYEAPR